MNGKIDFSNFMCNEKYFLVKVIYWFYFKIMFNLYNDFFNKYVYIIFNILFINIIVFLMENIIYYLLVKKLVDKYLFEVDYLFLERLLFFLVESIIYVIY